MRIPYNKIRTFSTVELPGVICDPPLEFEFIANPSFALVKDIANWLKTPEWNETKRLAAELIKAVIVPGGDRYELGTIGAIQELANQTEAGFIANLLNGWNTRVSLERITELKKTRPSLPLWSETGGDIPPA